tara:strand:+ start:208 stop:435 length:228 start_codon:yes stop_codon:yes gene_type:complete
VLVFKECICFPPFEVNVNIFLKSKLFIDYFDSVETAQGLNYGENLTKFRWQPVATFCDLWTSSVLEMNLSSKEYG